MARPTAFIHSFPHYAVKLRRSAYDATNNNPKCNEAPYYEVWDLWINDFIINQQDYSLRPQGLLSIDISTGRKANNARRYPDFIVYHNFDCEGSVGVQRDVAFIVEVKPWGPAMGEDLSTIVDEFTDREFLDQIRDHGKMILLEHKKARVWLMQCVGLFWRVGTLHNEDLSPFVSRRAPTGKNIPREHNTLVEWGPVRKIGDAASDIEQQAFWQKMAHDVD